MYPERFLQVRLKAKLIFKPTFSLLNRIKNLEYAVILKLKKQQVCVVPIIRLLPLFKVVNAPIIIRSHKSWNFVLLQWNYSLIGIMCGMAVSKISIEIILFQFSFKNDWWRCRYFCLEKTTSPRLWAFDCEQPARAK